MNENIIEVRCFTDGTSQIWVKDSIGRMIESIEYLSQAQLDEVCRDYHSDVMVDEREDVIHIDMKRGKEVRGW